MSSDRQVTGAGYQRKDSMKPTLYLLFNHTLTQTQEDDARGSLGVGKVVAPPAAVQDCWSGVPPEIDDLADWLEPVFSWLGAIASSSGPGTPLDFILVQGEFGATWLAVNEALASGLVPVYSTTSRKAEEEHLADGSVRVRHVFRHVRFRRYPLPGPSPSRRRGMQEQRP